MYFRFATLVVLLTAPLLTLAQDPNPFNIPQAGLSATAGVPLDLKWQPTTTGTVSLVLRSGASNDLNKGVTIASHIENSGSFTWTPADNLPRGSDYTIEIIDDSDPAQVNYTPPFILESTNVLPSTTVTSGTASSTSGSSTGTSTGSSTGSSSGTTASSGSMSTGTTGSSSGTTVNTARVQSRTGASFQPTTASSSQGSAARATAMAGMLGAVALGAFAL